MKKKVYIFFRESDHRPWYFRFLDRKFTHCFTYEHQLLGGYDSFIKMENLYNTIDSQIYFGSGDQLLELFEDCKCLLITVDVDPLKPMCRIQPITCVTLIKKQLGIDKPFIITPKQLYNHLITKGGTEV